MHWHAVELDYDQDEDFIVYTAPQRFSTEDSAWDYIDNEWVEECYDGHYSVIPCGERFCGD